MISARRPILELADAPAISDSIALLVTASALATMQKSGAGNLRSLASDIRARNLDLVAQLALHPEFNAGAGEILELPYRQGKKIGHLLLLGVGTNSAFDLKRAATALGRRLKKRDERFWLGHALKKELTNFLCAYALSQYEWSLPSATKKSERLIPTLILAPADQAYLSRAEILIEAVYFARDLIHTPSNIKSPDWMAQVAADHATHRSLKVKVRSASALAEFGGLAAIGGSSRVHPPRMIEISYTPRGGKDLPHVVLVGKGITFDTGGISLKRPYDAMMAMKSDMAGAAAVMATLLSLPALAPKVRVTGILMCAENAHSATAARPGDVITHYGGKTAEIIDTDAEGRLVLADGLAYAAAQLSPDYLVDIATLTGAATLGLGRQYAAMYSNDKKLSNAIAKIGERCGEKAWPMPLVKEYRPALTSAVADISNITSYASPDSFGGGSITAALYLQEFISDSKWLHLDIAGVGRSESDSGENVKGGTGYGPRLLLEWLASL